MLPPMQTSTSSAGAEPDLADLLRDSVADYCVRALPARRLRALRAAGQSFDRDVWREMAGLGWCGLVVPEAQGGLGLGAAAVASVCRQLGRVVAAEPVIECAVVAASLLAASAGQERHLNALLDGSTVYTCPLSASAWQTPLGARRDGDAYVLTGVLAQVALASDADVILVPALCDGALLLCAVPCASDGLALQVRVLADGTRDAQLRCEALRCPSSAVMTITAPAVQYALALGAVGGSAYLIGLCEALFETTLDYLRTRRVKLANVTPQQLQSAAKSLLRVDESLIVPPSMDRSPIAMRIRSRFSFESVRPERSSANAASNARIDPDVAGFAP